MNIRIVSRLLLPLFLLLAPSIVPAETAGEIEYRLRSEYIGLENRETSENRQWRVLFQPGETFDTLHFYPEGRESAACRLQRDRDEKTITMYENAVPRKSGDDGLLVMPGYPVPCQVVPAYSEKTTYSETKTAGGMAFRANYQVSRQVIDRQTAIDNGWITKPDAVPSRQLILVTVRDDKDRIVAKQLWPKQKDHWWIYEETPYRRSWRTQ